MQHLSKVLTKLVFVIPVKKSILTKKLNFMQNTTTRSKGCRRSINSYGQNVKDVEVDIILGQGTHFDEIICSNNDCPIFYRRKKVIKDISNCSDQIGRFDNNPAHSRKLP